MAEMPPRSRHFTCWWSEDLSDEEVDALIESVQRRGEGLRREGLRH